MHKGDPQKVLTVPVRLSYAHLFQPYSQDGVAEAKYSATLLLSKFDTACYNEIMQAIEAARQEGIRGPWKGACPPNLSVPIHDGDGVRERSGEPYGDECKGHWVISAKSKMKPECVHISNIHSPLVEGQIKSGDYARVMLRFYPYDSNGNRGVACGLGNVMMTQEGEPLGGQSSASSDFADFESNYTPQAAPVQSSYSSAPPPTYGQVAPPTAPPPNYSQTPAPTQNYAQAPAPTQNYAPAPTSAQNYAPAPAPAQNYVQPQAQPPYAPAPQASYGQPAAPDNTTFDPNVYMNGGYS